MATTYSDPKTRPALDEKYYSLSSEELAFFQTQTGIKDEKDLKDHILRIQSAAYEVQFPFDLLTTTTGVLADYFIKVYGYPCIRRFFFTKLKISRMPIYNHVLRLGREREGAVLVDIGCCLGNDVRKAVADGFPIHNVIASDLRQGFWDLGHELFKSTPESFPVSFIAGDVFDPAHLTSISPFYETPGSPAPGLSSITSLNPLRGHTSAIHASALFHLFSEETQLQLAHALACLLSPLPGSVLFGSHIASTQKGFVGRYGRQMFCHSPDSWGELWDGTVFKQGTVKVEAQLHQLAKDDQHETDATNIRLLVWSVERL